MNTDSELEEIIKGLDPYFKALGIDFFIVGARARDIISREAGLKLSLRKTLDVDFGLLVESWETLESMRDKFQSNPDIKLNNEANKVRYYYKGMPFDLVPFGGIEKKGEVSWPPFYDVIMTVVGYKEALASAKEIKIGSTSVKVVIPEMLVGLKLVSWGENPSRQRDAQDINYIMSNYESIDPDAYEYILENYDNILENFDHDTVLSSIALIGLRIKKTTSDAHLEIALNLLNDQQRKEKLARNMISRTGHDDGEEEASRLKLDALLYGLLM